MVVFFGTDRMVIKEFTFKDLNLEEEEIDTEGIPEKFIVFQNYIHFFFIPFFPEEKVYAFRAKGVLYKMPQGIKEHIEMEYPLKTPLVCYAGTVLLVALVTALITSTTGS